MNCHIFENYHNKQTLIEKSGRIADYDYQLYTLFFDISQNIIGYFALRNIKRNIKYIALHGVKEF